MILRKKHRYILVLSSRAIDANLFWKEIAREIMRFMGELSYSQSNPRMAAQYSPRLFVIQTRRSYERQVMLALAFVRQLNEGKIGMFTIKSSGTIRSLSEYSDAVGPRISRQPPQ